MKIKVLVYRRPNMFKVMNNLYHRIGTGELENIMNIEGYTSDHNSLTLFYPERFLNIIEQRALIYKAEKAGINFINITTSSVYIIQTVDSSNIGIIQDELITEKNKDIKLSNDESGMPFDEGLGIL